MAAKEFSTAAQEQRPQAELGDQNETAKSGHRKENCAGTTHPGKAPEGNHSSQQKAVAVPATLNVFRCSSTSAAAWMM